MRGAGRLVAAAFAAALLAAGASAGETWMETFGDRPETRWRFFADTVMGGVSTGSAEFLSEDGARFARLAGRVSTANNGGFIQMRADLPEPPPAGAAGVRLVVRGDGQRYFVHVRTGGTLLPWQYYQAGFETGPDWAEVRLPFSAFRASGALLRREPRPETIRSVALVAFGRDHDAQADLREIGFY